MSDLSTPNFDLSLLGISDRLPNDAEVTAEDSDAAFTAQVESVVRDLTASPGTSAGESGAEDDDPSSDTESGEVSDYGTSTQTDNAPSSEDVAVAPGDAEGESDSSPDSPSPPDSYYLPIPLNDGSTYELTVDAATDLLRLNAWAQSLPEKTRYAFAAIESGQAVAIPTKDYSLYSRWLEEQKSAPSLADELEDLDPAIAKRVRDLEAAVAAQPDPAAAQQQFEMQQRQASIQQTIGTTLDAYQQEHRLSEVDMQTLVATTAELGIIARLTEQNTLRAPNGQVLREADHAAVLRRSLDMVRSGGFVPSPQQTATATIPTHQPVAPVSTAPPPPAATVPSVSQQRVALKKARASSLSSAPSSAVSQPRSTDPLSMPDMEAQVRAALADAMRNGN